MKQGKNKEIKENSEKKFISLLSPILPLNISLK